MKLFACISKSLRFESLVLNKQNKEKNALPRLPHFPPPMTSAGLQGLNREAVPRFTAIRDGHFLPPRFNYLWVTRRCCAAATTGGSGGRPRFGPMCKTIVVVVLGFHFPTGWARVRQKKTSQIGLHQLPRARPVIECNTKR